MSACCMQICVFPLWVILHLRSSSLYIASQYLYVGKHGKMGVFCIKLALVLIPLVCLHGLSLLYLDILMLNAFLPLALAWLFVSF